MARKKPSGLYRIDIDERWYLDDLYVFPRNYEQAYFLAYSLLPDLSERALQRVDDAYRKYPWRGGYSAVLFYDHLKRVVPSAHRPTIRSIRYASPGILELALYVPVAYAIAKTVKYMASSLKETNSVYNTIMSDLQKRKLLRLKVRQKELELSLLEAKVIETRADTMARLVGFDGHQELTARTGHSFLTLKILLSYYRRLRNLAEFELNGKVSLPLAPEDDEAEDDEDE